MATNFLDEMRKQITAQQAPSRTTGMRSMYDMTPAGSSNWGATQAQEAANRRELMRLEEWNNRQKLYDPAYWSSIFGGGASAPAPTSAPAYTPSRYDRQLESLMADPNSIANSGAYRFRLGQGNQAIQRSAAAKGMLGSGNTLAALLEYGQGQASQEYGSQVDRLSALRGQDIGAQTAMRGQDLSLQAQREAANLQARNALAEMLMKQQFAQANQPSYY